MLATVTGASGHLGATLVRSLIEKKWKVRALVHNDTRALDGLDIESVRGDILDVESLKHAFNGADVVFHLAGYISIVDWNRRNVERTNIDGVRNVVDACMAAGVKRLVHTGSFHAHKQDPIDEPLEESRPLVDDCNCPPYNYSKAEGERIVCSAMERGLDAIIVNPTGIVGPNDYKPSHFGATLLLMATGRLPALVNAGLDWVDNRDVAGAMINASQKAKCGAKYFLSGHWVTIREIARQVADITGVKPARLVLPMWLARTVAPAMALTDRAMGRRPMFTPISMKELKSNPDVSHARAARELGYNPRPTEQTIADTLEWFRENGQLKLADKVKTGK